MRNWKFLLYTCVCTTVLVLASSLSSPLQASDGDFRNGSQKLGIGESFGRWPQGIVPWRYNPTNAPAIFSDSNYFLGLVESAIADIEGVSRVTFEYQGTTGAAPTTLGDGFVTMGWADIGGAAGVAGPWSSCTSQQVIDAGYCEYRDGSFQLNNNALSVDWDTGDTDTTERLLIQVVTHEFLHLLGVGHSDEPVSIMYANPYTNLNQLRDDDIDVLLGLYGNPRSPQTPQGYTAPAPGGTVINDSYVARRENGGSLTEITTVNDADDFIDIWVVSKVNGPLTETFSIVAEDPDGFYHQRGFHEHDCLMNQICTVFSSFLTADQIKTYPGTWSFHVIDGAGDLISTESISVVTNPVSNEPPPSTLAIDADNYWEFQQLIYGVAPMAVDMDLTVGADTEGDAVDASWHIPTVGETTVGTDGTGNCVPSCDEPFGVGGTTSKSVTFDTPGIYETYVTVNDDFDRYGNPGAGDAAGPGFRQLYRKEFRVTVSRDDVVGLTDVSGDTVPDLAVFEEKTTTDRPRVELFSGADGSSLGGISFLSTAWRGIAFDQVEDVDGNGVADDPGLAILSFNPATGRILVQVKRLDNFLTIRNIIYLDSKWTPIDIVVINDTNGDGNTNDTSIGVLARLKSNGKGHVEVRNFSDSAKIAGYSFLGTSFRAVATDVVPRAGQTPLLGVLAAEVSSGEIVVQSRQLSDGMVQADTTFLRSSWTAADLTATADGNNDGISDDPAWLVLGAREATGENLVQSRLVSTGQKIKNLSFLSTPFRISRLTSTQDISGNSREELVAFARRRGDAKRFIQVRDYDTTNITRNISP